MFYHYLRAYEGRGELSVEEEQNLRRIQLGVDGEKFVSSILSQSVPEGVCVMFDCWLDYLGITQIDALIIFPDLVYLINVKNYQFELRSGDEFSEKASRKNIRQLDKSRDKLKDILEDELNWHVPIKTVLMFASSKQLAPLPEPCADETVLSHEIAFWFRKLIRKHPAFQSYSRMQQIKEGILAHEGKPVDSRWLKGMTHEKICNNLKLGIRCPNCRLVNKMNRMNQMTSQCQCGFIVNNRLAILAAIDEYLALRVTNRFTRREVEEFVQIATRRNLIKILKTHFKLVQNGRYSYYIKES